MTLAKKLLSIPQPGASGQRYYTIQNAKGDGGNGKGDGGPHKPHQIKTSRHLKNN